MPIPMRRRSHPATSHGAHAGLLRGRLVPVQGVWNLAIWPSASVRSGHYSTSGQSKLHHPDGIKKGPSSFQEPQLTRPRDSLVP